MYHYFSCFSMYTIFCFIHIISMCSYTKNKQKNSFLTTIYSMLINSKPKFAFYIHIYIYTYIWVWVRVDSCVRYRINSLMCSESVSEWNGVFFSQENSRSYINLYSHIIYWCNNKLENRLSIYSFLNWRLQITQQQCIVFTSNSHSYRCR